MDEDVSQLIDNINAVITTNGNEEITGDILNSILNQIVSVFYGITGDKQYLDTSAKENLVEAINEVNNLLSQVNTIKLFSGTQDPNTFDVNGGEYEVRDFYMQTSTLGTIALWIYTGVIGVEWLNLTDRPKPIQKLEYEPDEVYNFPLSKKGDSFSIKIINTLDNSEIQNGKATLGGASGITVGNNSYLVALQDSPSGTFAQVGKNFLIVNGLRRYQEFSVLPASGVVGVQYCRTSDNTLWRWTNGGVFPYPTPQFVQLAVDSIASDVKTFSFTYDGDNATQTLPEPITEVIDVMFGGIGDFDEEIEFTVGETEVIFSTENLLSGMSVKLIYK